MTTGLSSGDLSYNGPIQERRLTPLILARNSGSGEESGTVNVFMRVPSARLRCRLSLIFIPSTGGPVPVFGFATIWVAAQEANYKGIGGGGGGRYVVTDLEGSQAAPFVIGGTAPNSNADVNGYSREFVTSSDWISAQLNLSSIGGGSAGVWIAQAKAEPAFTAFTWEEWDQLRRLFVIETDGKLIL